METHYVRRTLIRKLTGAVNSHVTCLDLETALQLMWARHMVLIASSTSPGTQQRCQPPPSARTHGSLLNGHHQLCSPKQLVLAAVVNETFFTLLTPSWFCLHRSHAISHVPLCLTLGPPHPQPKRAYVQVKNRGRCRLMRRAVLFYSDFFVMRVVSSNCAKQGGSLDVVNLGKVSVTCADSFCPVKMYQAKAKAREGLTSWHF